MKLKGEVATLGNRAFLKPFLEEVTEFRGENCSWHLTAKAAW